MSKISQKKKDCIMEEIMSILYENSLKPLFTYQIAELIARDNEFTLTLLKELEKKKLIRQSKDTKNFKVRKKWIIRDAVYKKYQELA